MSKAYSIRQLWSQGESVAAIAKKTGVSRDTVYKYRDMEDFSPAVPVKRRMPSKLNPYKPLIDQWLDDDMRCSRKQRHTAKRIHDRLVEELGADVSISTVERYVRQAKACRAAEREQFLDLAWAPGEAQADFGETDFYVRGVRRRMSYFVLTFPFSNVGLAQLFGGENAECVCQALVSIFEFIGGAPAKIVFDNAAGVGRRVGELVRTTELFAACAAHYGFRFRFCNPYSGHEKGSVEGKVGFIRRNLFVPVPQVWDVASWNEKLLERCMALSDKPHWLKGEPESQLFVEDQLALLGLPEKPFSCVSYVSRKADKLGKVRAGGKHFYSTDPAFANRILTVGLAASTVSVYDEDGAFICEHERAYGDGPTDSSDPASQLGLLAVRIGAWENSRVRAALPDALREHMDGLREDELRREVRLMRDQAAVSGWEACVQAMGMAYAATGRVDAASVAVSAARLSSGAISYDEPVDLAEYDAAMGLSR